MRQRRQTRLRIGFSLVAMAAVLALIAFMTMVSNDGGTMSVSAAGPTPTPGATPTAAPLPTPDPNWSKIKACIDAKVVGGAAWNAAQIKALVTGADTIWGQARINITWNNSITNVADPVPPNATPTPGPGVLGDILDTDVNRAEFDSLGANNPNNAGQENCVRVFFIGHFVDNAGQKTSTLAEVDGEGLGHYLVMSIQAKANFQTLAHELGHIFGLQHVVKPGNLMAKFKVETYTLLNPGQITAARTLATAISAQPTTTPPPTATPPPAVGGIAELPKIAETPLETAATSGPNTGFLADVAAAVAAATVTLCGAAWYARKRWLL